MPIISDFLHLNTDALEEKLRSADFSAHTDLKAKLAGRLFQAGDKPGRAGYAPLSDDDAELISAARGIRPEDPWIN